MTLDKVFSAAEVPSLIIVLIPCVIEWTDLIILALYPGLWFFVNGTKLSSLTNIILFSLAGVPPLGGFFAKFYVFVAVLEKQMYALAIIGLLTTVMSAFYYLKIIKTIYFDDSVITFESSKNKTAQISIFTSCIILVTFFLYPSVLNNIVNTLFIN